MVVNSNGSVNGQGIGGIGILGQCPDGRQLSPLTSPLLTDAGCVRNDDDEEARRKVGMQTGRGWTENIHSGSFIHRTETNVVVLTKPEL